MKKEVPRCDRCGRRFAHEHQAKPRDPTNEQVFNFELLKSLRAGRRLSLVGLAKGSGVSFLALRRLERGEGNPRVLNLIRLARFFGCKLMDFITVEI